MNINQMVEALTSPHLAKYKPTREEICREIYEVWAGSEGIPLPETACEAYLLRLIEEMRDIAKRGL